MIFRSVYYKRLYTTCVQEACEALLKAERYQQVVELCDQAKLMEQMDLRVHEMKMAAYLKLNQPQNALDYYNQVANLCYSNLGMEVPDHLKELYELILQSLPTQKPVDVEELEKGLREENYPLELSTAIMISLKISIRSMCARRAGRCVPDS